MPDALDVKADFGEVLQQYARLKNVPLAKVLRNMARDYSQAAFQVTPIAKAKKLDLALFLFNGGRTRGFNIGDFKASRRGNKRAYAYRRRQKGASLEERLAEGTELKRAVIHRGWSKATWFGIFAELGMNASRTKARSMTAKQLGSAAYSGGGEAMSITLRQNVDFTSPRQSGAPAMMFAAGYANARSKVLKDIARQIERGKWE